MSRLDPEARMTIKTLAARGASNSDIARLRGVTEGAVRYHKKRPGDVGDRREPFGELPVCPLVGADELQRAEHEDGPDEDPEDPDPGKGGGGPREAMPLRVVQTPVRA